jgi:hypothetical protein
VWRTPVPDEEQAGEPVEETIGPTLERAGFRVVATERRHALEVS